MTVIKSIDFECGVCAVRRTTTEFEFEEQDDGSCGDPECCGGPEVWVSIYLTCPMCSTKTSERVDN